MNNVTIRPRIDERIYHSLPAANSLKGIVIYTLVEGSFMAWSGDIRLPVALAIPAIYHFAIAVFKKLTAYFELHPSKGQHFFYSLAVYSTTLILSSYFAKFTILPSINYLLLFAIKAMCHVYSEDMQTIINLKASINQIAARTEEISDGIDEILTPHHFQDEELKKRIKTEILDRLIKFEEADVALPLFKEFAPIYVNAYLTGENFWKYFQCLYLAIRTTHVENRDNLIKIAKTRLLQNPGDWRNQGFVFTKLDSLLKNVQSHEEIDDFFDTIYKLPIIKKNDPAFIQTCISSATKWFTNSRNNGAIFEAVVHLVSSKKMELIERVTPLLTQIEDGKLRAAIMIAAQFISNNEILKRREELTIFAHGPCNLIKTITVNTHKSACEVVRKNTLSILGLVTQHIDLIRVSNQELGDKIKRCCQSLRIVDEINLLELFKSISLEKLAGAIKLFERENLIETLKFFLLLPPKVLNRLIDMLLENQSLFTSQVSFNDFFQTTLANSPETLTQFHQEFLSLLQCQSENDYLDEATLICRKLDQFCISQESELAQLAIKITCEDTWPDRSKLYDRSIPRGNPFVRHGQILIETSAPSKKMDLWPETIGKDRVILNLEHLRKKASQKKTILVRELPESIRDINHETLKGLFAITMTSEKEKTIKETFKKYMGIEENFAYLKGHFLNHPFIVSLLSFDKSNLDAVVPQNTYYLCAIVAYLNTLKNEEVTLDICISLAACGIGKLDQFPAVYNDLPKEFKVQHALSTDFALPPNLQQGYQFVDEVAQLALGLPLSTESLLIKELYDLDPGPRIANASHYTLEAKNRLCRMIGLRHFIWYDPYPDVLPDAFLFKTPEEIAEIYFKHVTPKTFIKALQDSSRQQGRFNSYCELLDIHPSNIEKVNEAWETKDEGFTYTLTEESALKIWKMTNYFL